MVHVICFVCCIGCMYDLVCGGLCRLRGWRLVVYICCCFLLIGYRIWLLVCLWGELLDLFVDVYLWVFIYGFPRYV